MVRLNRKGFSAIELMVVIAIIGITAAIAIPSMISWRAEHKLRGSANNFKADLQMARLRAIREAGFVAVVINGANNYTVFVDDGGSTPGNAGNYIMDAGELQLRNRTMPTGVTMQNITLAGNRTRFNSRGMPNLTGAGTVEFLNNTGNTTQVIMNNVGRTRIQ